MTDSYAPVTSALPIEKQYLRMQDKLFNQQNMGRSLQVRKLKRKKKPGRSPWWIPRTCRYFSGGRAHLPCQNNLRGGGEILGECEWKWTQRNNTTIVKCVPCSGWPEVFIDPAVLCSPCVFYLCSIFHVLCMNTKSTDVLVSFISFLCAPVFLQWRRSGIQQI